MSAWIVSRVHIDLLVRLTLERQAYQFQMGPTWRTDPNIDPELVLDPTRIGRMLWLENLASVAARYPQDGSGSRPGHGDTDAEIAGYTYRDPGYLPTPGEACKLVSCYDYQSCEHDGWERSEARSLCLALTHCQIGRIPDYDSSPWGWEEKELAAAKARDGRDGRRHLMVYDGGRDAASGRYACEANGLFTRNPARVTCPDCQAARLVPDVAVQ